MLRQTLARTSLRASRQGVKAASKTFATSARRQAEVELTIGMAPVYGEWEDDVEC